MLPIRPLEIHSTCQYRLISETALAEASKAHDLERKPNRDNQV